jgi:hypothetical protein
MCLLLSQARTFLQQAGSTVCSTAEQATALLQTAAALYKQVILAWPLHVYPALQPPSLVLRRCRRPSSYTWTQQKLSGESRLCVAPEQSPWPACSTEICWLGGSAGARNGPVKISGQ